MVKGRTGWDFGEDVGLIHASRSTPSSEHIDGPGHKDLIAFHSRIISSLFEGLARQSCLQLDLLQIL